MTRSICQQVFSLRVRQRGRTPEDLRNHRMRKKRLWLTKSLSLILQERSLIVLIGNLNLPKRINPTSVRANLLLVKRLITRRRKSPIRRIRRHCRNNSKEGSHRMMILEPTTTSTSISTTTRTRMIKPFKVRMKLQSMRKNFRTLGRTWIRPRISSLRWIHRLGTANWQIESRIGLERLTNSCTWMPLPSW